MVHQSGSHNVIGFNQMSCNPHSIHREGARLCWQYKHTVMTFSMFILPELKKPPEVMAPSLQSFLVNRRTVSVKKQ